jgi:hypothetical protein
MRTEHKSLLSFTELMATLNQACNECKTGTLFISSEDNRAISFVLKQGQIVSCSYGHLRGQHALPAIGRLQAGSCAFSEKVFFSLMDERDLPHDNAELFATLGYSDYVAPTAETSMSSNHDTQIYRGVVIPHEPKASPNAAMAHRKSRRIYRGQILEA